MGSVILAVHTLSAIEAAITADQGAAYRQHLERVLPHIGDAYRGEDDPFRSHLGASMIGGECGRALWYGFHWTTIPHFGARILRLFNRGHLEEGRFIAALLTIGVQVYQQDEQGNQFRISDVGGHFGGSGDGVGIGIPDVPPETPCLLEFKTHGDKSYKKLAKEGVRAAKFEHFVQMQTYMRKMGLAVALYGAVNKNDDDFYFEIVHLDSGIADQFIDRARQIITSPTAPDKISKSPGWFACKWCDHRAVCHLKGTPSRNCRTCKFSKANEDGNWYCSEPATMKAAPELPVEISKKVQLKGCQYYEVFCAD